MIDGNKSVILSEAVSRFMGDIPDGDVEVGQRAINRFVRWFGRERRMDSLTASEIANYAQRISSSDTDYQNKLDTIKAFLTEAKNKGWTVKNLSLHLKIKKAKTRAGGVSGRQKEAIAMTREGYEAIKSELESLKKQRPQIVEQIRMAAEDKDFRENAPLDAAKERMGHLEGRIIELEETLKLVQIIDAKAAVLHTVSTGDCVVLVDLPSGEELRYTIVSPREVNPAKGKISNASPIGKAVIGKESGATIEIETPAGELCYRIAKVERK